MEKRTVSIAIGTRTYSLVTSLGEARLKSVTCLLEDALNLTDSGMLQDERLFLAALRLASALASVSATLDVIIGEENKTGLES